MGGSHGESNQRIAIKDRDTEGHIRPMRRAVVRRVVHDYVAGAELFLTFSEDALNAAHITGDWSQLQRSAKSRLAQLLAFRIEQRSPEVLRLPDNAGIRHAGQLVAHLHGNIFQSSPNNLCRDRIDAAPGLDHRVGHRTHLLFYSSPSQEFRVITRLPHSSARAFHAGGNTVVVSF